MPLHAGTGPGLSARRLGSKSGAETETLTTNQLPSHTHQMRASDHKPDTGNPAGKQLAHDDGLYRSGSDTTSFNNEAISNTGGSGHHNNLMPYLCINYIIALFGIYPSRQ